MVELRDDCRCDGGASLGFDGESKEESGFGDGVDEEGEEVGVGIKVHVEVDAESKLVHSVAVTLANIV